MVCSLKNKKILITCGPTWVPIDDVRIISNTSTGAMGQTIAREFNKAGAKVTLLQGPVKNSIKDKSIKVIDFTFFNELSNLLKKELRKNYNIVVHTAAVSDYKVDKKLNRKIKSNLKKLKLNLVPTEKLINLIKELNKKVTLVGFKLETKITEAIAKEKAKQLINNSKCDIVVANNNPSKNYKAYILDKNLNVLKVEKDRDNVSKSLIKELKKVYS